MTETGSTVERLQEQLSVAERIVDAQRRSLDRYRAVVEAAQEWAKRDDQSCSHSDTQQCVACEMEIYDLAQAIKPKLAALHSQASDEGKQSG